MTYIEYIYFEYIFVFFTLVTEMIEIINFDSVNLLNEYGGITNIEL
jgi:hypothetical protein